MARLLYPYHCVFCDSTYVVVLLVRIYMCSRQDDVLPCVFSLYQPTYSHVGKHTSYLGSMLNVYMFAYLPCAGPMLGVVSRLTMQPVSVVECVCSGFQKLHSATSILFWLDLDSEHAHSLSSTLTSQLIDSRSAVGLRLPHKGALNSFGKTISKQKAIHPVAHPGALLQTVASS